MNEIIQVEQTGFLFNNEVFDYIAKATEEIPVKEEHARAYLTDRLGADISKFGIFVFSRKAALIVSRPVLKIAEKRRLELGLQRVIPINPETIHKILAIQNGAVLSIGKDESEFFKFTEPNVEKITLPLSAEKLSVQFGEIFGQSELNLIDFIEKELSSQKLAGNAEGAKRPTPILGASHSLRAAGDEGCEFTSHPEACPERSRRGGRVPPFIEKLQKELYLERGKEGKKEISFPDNDGNDISNAEAWKLFSRVQGIFENLKKEIVPFLRNSDSRICLTGSLAKSAQFVKLFQKFFRVRVIPIEDFQPILRTLVSDVHVFPAPFPLQIPFNFFVFSACFLFLNLCFYQSFLTRDLEYLKGIESLQKAISEVGTANGIKSPAFEDVDWLNKRLAERQISWTTLFSLLEAAKPSDLIIDGVEMVPRNAISVEVRGNASSIEEIRKFLANLQSFPEFGRVFLSSYRERGSRFIFSLSLEHKQ